MKNIERIVLVLCLFSAGFITGCQTDKGQIKVSNTGRTECEFRINTDSTRNILGPGGSMTFSADSVIYIGDAAITVGKRVEVKNTGSDMLELTYNDAGGKEQAIMLGADGVGYIDIRTPFTLNESQISIDNVK